MAWDAYNSSSKRANSESGFGLVETLVSIFLLTVTSLSVAQLFAVAATSNTMSRSATSTSLLAVEKMEQLRSLTWGFAPSAAGDLGPPLSDLTTDVSVVPPTNAGPGLGPSPNGVLETNTPMYVDFLNAHGQWIGTGSNAPAGTVYVRRWSVEPLPTSPNETLVLQVMTTTLRQEELYATAGGGTRGRLPDDTWLISVKTRKAL